jgi:hypothetical protein
MDETSTTSDNLDQIDEDIVTYTASDEALEAAAGGGCDILEPSYAPTAWYCC